MTTSNINRMWGFTGENLSGEEPLYSLDDEPGEESFATLEAGLDHFVQEVREYIGIDGHRGLGPKGVGNPLVREAMDRLSVVTLTCEDVSVALRGLLNAFGFTEVTGHARIGLFGIIEKQEYRPKHYRLVHTEKKITVVMSEKLKVGRISMTPEYGWYASCSIKV